MVKVSYIKLGGFTNMNLDDLLGDGMLDFLTSSSGELNIDQLFDDIYEELVSAKSTHLGAVGQGSSASAGVLQPHPPLLALA